MIPPVKFRLGEILVKKGLISDEDLEQALVRGRQTGRKLGRVLVEQGKLNEADIAKAVAGQTALPFVDLRSVRFQPAALARIPEALARRTSSIPVEVDASGGLVIAMSDPADVFALDEIGKVLGSGFGICVATESDVFSSIDMFYRKTDEIGALAGALSKEVGDDVFDFAQIQAVGSDEAPVVRLLQSIFEDAIASRASDIHLEPMESRLVIRFRIDGTLRTQNTADQNIAAAVCQRLKLISGLNISEKRLPQDGRFHVRVHRSVVDVRIVTAPSSHGESVVMRLLNQGAGRLSLDGIGMPEDFLGVFKEALARPQGMILVTGPTGSGKTTTLYGAVNEINTDAVKIITVENPVEYSIDGITQMQTHEKIGLGFATCLRSILRQDPDVILIGEMRDAETVESALRASMTGHLVLSTLHTNDAKSVPARLMDLGAEKFMVASSLHLVMAQRLLRLVCGQCKTAYKPSETELGWLYGRVGEGSGSGVFYKGAGCSHCANSGFVGRAAVYEILVMDDDLVKTLYREDVQGFTEAAGRKIGKNTIGMAAARLALDGRTTLAEARRVDNED